MLDILPRRALFRFELPLFYHARTPPIDGNVRKWDGRYRLPPLVEIEERPAIADVYFAWNDDYVFFAFDVPGRHGPLVCEPKEWWKKDGVRMCIDTRDARDVKRGTAFCHFFYGLPAGGGPQQKSPIIGQHRLSRAKDHPPAADLSRIKAASHVERARYALEVAIPAACLNGWDPAEHSRIGLFYKVNDTRLGAQHLTVDDELGWNADPSTWATGVLVRDAAASGRPSVPAV